MKRNKAELVGNVGQDPVIKILESGTKIATFSLATTEKFKDRQGNPKEETEWHNLVAFDKKADLVEKYVRKGKQLGIEGSLKTRNYEKDGVTHYRTEIRVSSILFLASKESSEGDGRQ